MRLLLFTVFSVLFLSSCVLDKNAINFTGTRTGTTEESKSAPFVTVWRVSSDGGSITLPLYEKSSANYYYTYDFTVDWGDGSSSSVTSFDDPDTTHIYTTAGDYTVSISGTCETITFYVGTGAAANRNKLIKVLNLGVVGWKNLGTAFYDCEKLTHFYSGITDTSNVTSMTAMLQLYGSSNGVLVDLDLSTLDTSKVTGMMNMFFRRAELTSLDLSNFDTSMVQDMQSMFAYMTNLSTLNISNFNTSNVSNMSYMFYGNSSITTLDLSNFDTSNATTMNGMFNGSTSLTSLDISSFNTSKVTNMYGLFAETAMSSLDLTHFDTHLVTNLDGMLYGMANLTTLDVSNWNVSAVSAGYGDLYTATNPGLVITCNNQDSVPDGTGAPATGTFFGKTCN